MKDWIRLLRFARPHTPGLLASLALSFLGIGIEVLKPWPMKLIVDSALGGQPLPETAAWLYTLPSGATPGSLLVLLCIATIALFVVSWANRVANAYIQAGVGTRMNYALGARIFERLQELSLGYHSRRSKGDLVKRVTTDSGCLRALTFDVALPAVTSIATLITTFVIMWRLDRLLALLATTAAPLFALCLRRYIRPMQERSYEQMQLQGQIMASAEQTLTALPIVRAFGRERHEDERFASLCRLSDRAYLRALEAQLRFKMSSDSVVALGTAAVIAVGGMHVVSGTLSVGALFVFISYLAALYSPLETLAYLSQSLASASAGSRRVFEVLDETDEIRDQPGAVDVPQAQRGHVQFEGVAFGYTPTRLVLSDVYLDAQPGEVIALVGSTGAGKSTLVSLIPRLHDVSAGRVLFNGVDVRRLRVAGLRASISIVQQESLLFPLSVHDNIAYGRPGASREDVVAAAMAANADSFITHLPQGYDTVLGERGATLSGGERRRIAIARALLKDAPVLILDEPTASLDAQTEALVIDAVERLMRGRTTFIIAHRLATARRATRIIVLEHGSIIESGTHEELLERGGVYARMHELQFSRPAHNSQEVFT